MNSYSEYQKYISRYYKTYRTDINTFKVNNITNTNNSTSTTDTSTSTTTDKSASTATDAITSSPTNTVQTHVHEFVASTKLAEEKCERHNHRFAGVTSQVIPLSGGNHKHVLLVNTDFFDHLHEVGAQTGPAIEVGNGKHVHFVEGTTTVDDDHFHNFAFATLIQAPLLPLYNK